MLCLRFVLVVLCLVLPLKGFSQTSQPGAEPIPPPLVPAPVEPESATPAEEPAKPQGELIPRQPSAQEGEDPVVLRIVLESVGSVVGTGLGLVPGVLVLRNASGANQGGEVVLGVLLTAAGASLGMSLGIMAGGSLLGGQGRFSSTLGGVWIGLLGGAAAAGLASPLGVLGLLGPFVGGIYFYEKSHARAMKAGAVARSQVRMVPLVSVSPEGGLIGGLAGRF